MKKTEQAVAVAKDVLKRLQYGKLDLKRRSAYFKFKRNFPFFGSLQEKANIVEENCQVCALGGFLLSYGRVYNNILCDEVFDDFSIIANKLKKIFPEKTIALIEAVFERKLIRPALIATKAEKQTLAKFGYGDLSVISSAACRDFESYQTAKRQIAKYHDAIVKKAKPVSRQEKARSLLREICKNIIRNDGEFILPE